MIPFQEKVGKGHKKSLTKWAMGIIMLAEGTERRITQLMAAGLITQENFIPSSQIEDVKEYIQLLQILNKEEKREFHGFMRGMQVMKEIMSGSTQEMVV